MPNHQRYVMTREILAHMETYTLRQYFSATQQKQLVGENLVHICLKEYEGNPIHNKIREEHTHTHGKSILVLKGSVQEILPILIRALQNAGYEGKVGEQQETFTTKLLNTLRSFDPTPHCFRCNQPILEGQEIISVKTRGRRRLYHSVCWDSMHLE